MGVMNITNASERNVCRMHLQVWLQTLLGTMQCLWSEQHTNRQQIQPAQNSIAAYDDPASFSTMEPSSFFAKPEPVNFADAWQWMWFLRLQTGDKQLPFCFTLDCNQNFGQGQEWQLLNRFLSCSAINAWAYSQMHDNDSITALFAMNVISRASNWGQLSFCLTLGSKYNSWQGQEWQLLNRFLSCSATNSCVSDQMHDNDSITEHFPMNVIP